MVLVLNSFDTDYFIYYICFVQDTLPFVYVNSIVDEF